MTACCSWCRSNAAPRSCPHNLVRVADPTNLKGEVRIARTQTKDLRLGQTAEIDTATGIVQGKVARIDPPPPTAPSAWTSSSTGRCQPARVPT